jgi:hypothetical protein
MKFILSILLTIFLFSLTFVSAVSYENQSIINEYISNSTIQLNQNITVDELIQSEVEEAIVFNNISEQSYSFTNINESYTAKLNISGLSNSLIYFTNNSVVCSNVEDCTANIAFIVQPLEIVKINNQYNLTENNNIDSEVLNISLKSTYTSGSKSFISYYIESKIKDNLTFNFYPDYVSCYNLEKIELYFNSTYMGDLNYSCEDGYFSVINLTDIQESYDSNEEVRLVYSLPGNLPSGSGTSGSVDSTKTNLTNVTSDFQDLYNNQTNKTTDQIIDDLKNKEIKGIPLWLIVLIIFMLIVFVIIVIIWALFKQKARE